MRNPQNDTRAVDLTGPPAKAGAQRTKNSGGSSSDSERTCVLTRRTAAREALIRLALGPDGEVAPDVRAKADGRGAWIGVGRKVLDEANAKG